MSGQGQKKKSGSLGKSSSLPAIDRRVLESPFFDKQALVTVDMRSKKIHHQSVDFQGSVKKLGSKNLSFMAAERGLEWEGDHAKAQIPPDRLPPVPAVIRQAMREFGLEFPPRRDSLPDRVSRGDPSFGGCGLHRCGPKLPLNRPKPVLDLNTPPPSPPPQPKEPKKKKRSTSPKRDAKMVAFAESVLKKLAEPEPPEPEFFAEPEDDDAEIEMPWSEEELREVFNKFDSDRDDELDVDDLTPLLRYLGAKPEPEEVQQLIKEQTKYATIEWDEFFEFMQRFRQHDIAKLRKAFKEADDDGSGVLNQEEVEKLLRKLEYAPTAQVVHEAMDAVDKDKSGDISFREFEALREYIRKTEGFLMVDIKELQELYVRAAGGKNRELDTAEIWRITMFRGYANPPEDIKRIAAEVDSDGTGTVSFVELLKIIRRVREIESEDILKVLRSRGDLDSNKVFVSDLGIALSDLGYFVSEEAVFDILEHIGSYESEEYVTLDELMAFLRAYRRCEGFSKAEMAELEESFNAEDSQGTGSIGALELGRILRNMGFSSSLQKVQRMVEEIDFDGSGMVEMDEFAKLMRRLLQGEAKKRKDVFQLFDPQRVGKIALDTLPRTLQIIEEVQPNKKHIDTALSKAPEGTKEFTNYAFEKFYKTYHQAIVEEIRRNAGYGPKEIIEMTKIFKSYDNDDSGTIERSELQKLIAQYFPDATKSRAQQVEMQKMLESFNTGPKSGELDFHKFIWLMRKCDDMRDEADVRMEVEVVKECELSVEEVEGFRQIFSSTVDWSGELDLNALKDLLERVIDLTDEDVEELGTTVEECHPHGRQVARFPSFLKLIKRLTDDNMLNVNDAASRAVKREQSKKQQPMTKTKTSGKEGKETKEGKEESKK